MIQELADNFIGVGEVKGFKFEKVLTTEKYYIYSVLKVGEKRHFEVIRRIVSPICLDFKNRTYSEVDFKEYYPKSNRFGIDGFNCSTYEKAVNKLKAFE